MSGIVRHVPPRSRLGESHDSVPPPSVPAHDAKPIYSIKRDTSVVEALVFSPDRKLLATGNRDGVGRIWDLAADQPTERVAFRLPSVIGALAFAPSGRSLAAACSTGYGKILELSGHSAREGGVLRGSRNSLDALAFSADGKLVAGGGGDQILRIWDAEAGGDPRTLLPGHTQPIRVLAFAPDGKSLATGSQDASARVWALNRIRPGQQMCLPHAGEVSTLAFTPDGRTLVTSGKDKVIWLWDLTAVKPTVRSRFAGHAADTRLVHVTADGDTVVTVGDGSDVMNWSPRSGRLRCEWKLPPGPASRFALTPDGRYLARGLMDGTVQVFRVADRRKK